MIVYIAGMPRSGSTFSFNIVRELLAADGSVYWTPIADLDDVRTAASGSKHIIIKAHLDNPPLRALVMSGEALAICTVRAVEDAVFSTMEMFDASLAEAIDYFRRWFETYRAIAGVSLSLDFDDIEFRPQRVVRKIAGFLGMPANGPALSRRYSKEAVAGIARGLVPDAPNVWNIGFSYFDRETFFHRRHISSKVPRAALDLLSAEDVALIRHELREEIRFLRHAGFAAGNGRKRPPLSAVVTRWFRAGRRKLGPHNLGR